MIWKNCQLEPKTIVVSSFPKTEHGMYSVHNRKKTPKPSNLHLKNLSLYFSEFCESTTIHGVKYMGQRGRYLVEKLIWTIVVVTICTVCLILIQKTYDKWKTSPVIVTFATTETPISQIPFPAVTVCPEAKFDSDIFNYTKTVKDKIFHKNLSKEEEDYFLLSLLICGSAQYAHEFGMNFINSTIDPELVEEIFEIAPEFDPLNETKFKWMGKELTFPISLTLTSEGLCYTFNMLKDEEIFRMDQQFKSSKSSKEEVRQWSLEDGYPPGDNRGSFPRRTFVSGFEGGFMIDALFTNHSHLDFLCEESLQGYKVALHHPSESPNMEKHFRLPLDQAVFVGVKPTMITVSKEVLHYEPQIRQCYFAKEKYLSMYKLYTQENCLVECLANYTLSQCGCLPFYMPTCDNDTKLCGPGSNTCVKISKVKYLENETSSDLVNQQCNCLPSCTSLSYDVETSQTDWNWQKMFEVFADLDPSRSEYAIPNKESSHFSRLVVYYKDLQFLTSKRKEMFGSLDFFSSMGGLLGLFVGFSVTSVIEILYFLTLRLICNIKKYGKNTWCGEPELLKDT